MPRDPRLVYLEPAWKMHSLYREFLDHPPPGWQFVLSTDRAARVVTAAGTRRWAHQLKGRILTPLLPASIVKAMVDRFAHQPPPGAVLTYASQHVVFRDEPWVADVEMAHVLAGGAGWGFGAWSVILRRALSSGNCRGIIAWSRAAARSLELLFPRETIQRKVTVIPLARRANSARRQARFTVEPLHLLFVNSANIPDQFTLKGGNEVFGTYGELRRRGMAVELTVRSDVPRAIGRRYAADPNIRILPRYLPPEQLEEEFLRADIFLCPSHVTPGMVMLDAMSYELPIVTIDAFANSELVQDGVNGIVVEPSARIDYEKLFFVPGEVYREARKLGNDDPEVVQRLADAVQRLADRPEERVRMGQAGRHAIEAGPFSVTHRNELLASFLGAAVDG